MFEDRNYNSLKSLLDREVARINTPMFIANDPVQFPRRFSKQQDIEIVSLLTSAIAWGNRKMICRNCEKLLDILHNDPLHYVTSQAYENLEDFNIHRTFFSSDLKYYLRGLHYIYSKYTSLEDFAYATAIARSPYPAWHLAGMINKVLAQENCGNTNSRCLPTNIETSALKRLNMALRWLVRNDGIVDMGIWTVIKPAQLFIPFDVHVGNVSRRLGLITRRSNDKKAAVNLTEKLRTFDAKDPIKYDFALFGIGIGL